MCLYSAWHGEGIEAGINLADFLLCGVGGLLFDDRTDLCALRDLAQNAAISKGIGEIGGQQGHRGFLSVVEGAQLLNGLGGDQRCVAGKHDDLLVWRESFACDHQGVAGASLLGLQDEINARVR